MSFFVRYPDPAACVTREQVINLADTNSRLSTRMMLQDNGAVHPYWNFRERRMVEAGIAGNALRSCSDVYTYRIQCAPAEHQQVQPIFVDTQNSPWNNQNARNVTKTQQNRLAPFIPSRSVP